MLNIFRINAIM